MLEAELQREFLEAYEARRTDQSIRTVAQRLEITDQELRRWLREPTFRDKLRELDCGRVLMAREVAMRHITPAIENMARVAEGNTRAAVRAGFLLARITGLVDNGPSVVVNNAPPNPRDVAQILREMREVDSLIEEHIKNAAGGGD